MTTRHKLALGILWAFTAVAMVVGYFGFINSLPLWVLGCMGLEAVAATYFILGEANRK